MATLILKYESKVLREYPIQKSAMTVGRAPGNEIVIDNLAVSGTHLRVAVEERTFVVEDLNSLNGTFLNGQRIRKSSLKEGDQIVIGKHSLEFSEKGGLSILMMMPMDISKDAARADQTSYWTPSNGAIFWQRLPPSPRVPIRRPRHRSPVWWFSLEKPISRNTFSPAKFTSSAKINPPPCA